MADQSLRQRVLDAVNVLEDAVNVLEGNTSANSGQRLSNLSASASARQSAADGTVRSAGSSPSTSGRSTGPLARRPSTSQLAYRQDAGSNQLSSGASQPTVSSLAPSRSNVHSELSGLFSWNSGTPHSTGKKGRGKRPMGSSSASYKKKKLKTWTHTFMCLSRVNHCSIPDARERTNLKLAGLGEKKFAVFAYGCSSDLQDELFREYPKLESGGGFELLRASDAGGKDLVPIDIPHHGYSVEYLQAIVKTAKIYIRPLQRDLDPSPVIDEGEVAEEYCFTCNKFIAVNLLKDHLAKCKEDIREQLKTKYSSTYALSKYCTNLNDVAKNNIANECSAMFRVVFYN